MDWLGRGRSGWMADQGDYSLATYAEQLRQMVLHLGGRPVALLGSSMGGSAAIELIARHPELVERLILNDVGPHIPARRRLRRAETIARHYVFRSPSDLLRKVGASQKNDGPLGDDIRFNLTFHQTRWSDDEGGRIYRHDVRALQAYRHDAQRSLTAVGAMAQGALPDAAGARPAVGRAAAGDHRPHAAGQGDHADARARHRPHALAGRPQPDLAFIREWLLGSRRAAGRWSVLHAPPREPYPGHPVPFAPAHVLNV
jgi:pimeloyl-ACP methyl ester carboxylesterase